MNETTDSPPKISRLLLSLMFAVLLLGAAVALMITYPSNDTYVPTDVIPKGAVVSDDKQIKAGLRVGFVTLGMPIADVEGHLGPGKARPEEDAVLYLFAEQGLTVACSDNKVHSIFVTSPIYYLQLLSDEKIAVGSDVNSVIRGFGTDYERSNKNEESYTLDYWKSGIHFNIEEDVITSILINQPVF